MPTLVSFLLPAGAFGAGGGGAGVEAGFFSSFLGSGAGLDSFGGSGSRKPGRLQCILDNYMSIHLLRETLQKTGAVSGRNVETKERRTVSPDPHLAVHTSAAAPISSRFPASATHFTILHSSSAAVYPDVLHVVRGTSTTMARCSPLDTLQIKVRLCRSFRFLLLAHRSSGRF